MCGTYEKQGRENQTKAQGEKGFSVERFQNIPPGKSGMPCS